MFKKKIPYTGLLVGNHLVVSEPFIPDGVTHYHVKGECLNCGAENNIPLSRVCNGYGVKCRCERRKNGVISYPKGLRIISSFDKLMSMWDPNTHIATKKKLPIFSGTLGQEYISCFTYVDDRTYTWAKRFMWIKQDVYVLMNWTRENCERAGLEYTGHKGGYNFLHKCVLPSGNKSVTDHINRCVLDNTSENLRISDSSKNSRNSKSSRYKYKDILYTGVIKKKLSGGYVRYRSRIWYKGKHKYLGTFDTITEAGQVYDVVALMLFGDEASLNYHPNNYIDNSELLESIKDKLGNRRSPMEIDIQRVISSAKAIMQKYPKYRPRVK